MITTMMLIESISDPAKKNIVEDMYIKYSRIAKKIACYYVNDIVAAQDILHEAFRIISEESIILRFTTAEENFPLLKKIIRNESFDYLKSRNREVLIDEFEDIELRIMKDRGIDIPDSIIKKEEMKILMKEINNLPYKQKSVIDGYYLNGHTDKQIGAYLKITGDNVRKIKSRARKMLKESLTEKEGEKNDRN